MLIRFILFCLVATAASTATAQTSLFGRMDSFVHSDGISIEDFMHDWKGRYRSGENAIVHGRLEFGGGYDQWQISLFKRWDYEMEFSKDTAELFYRAANKLPLDTGRVFALHLLARQTNSNGIRLGRDFYLPQYQLKIGVGASYLQGLRLTDGYINGTATATSDKDYNFQFDVDYYYSKDTLFKRPLTGTPNGDGMSLDLHLDWRPLPDIHLLTNIRDIGAFIRWHNAPHTQATAGSDVKHYNSDGYVQYAPVLSGREEYRNFKQRIPTTLDVEGRYRFFPSWELIARLEHYKAADFSGLGTEYALTETQQLRLLYFFESDAATVAYSGQLWRIGVTFDQIKVSHLHTFSLNAAFTLPL